MARSKDVDRLLLILQDNIAMSNRQAKAILNLSDKRYIEVVDELMGNNIIEKYQCRGGGIRLLEGQFLMPSSGVTAERDLYEPLRGALIKENGAHSNRSLVINTSTLKRRGQWQNPDLLQFTVQAYKNQRINRLVIESYEVKKWQAWDLSSVYEAAAHRRIANRSFLVLEWLREVDYEGTEQIEAECVRHGIGLLTMFKYYSGYRYIVRVDAATGTPDNERVEEYLEYIFEKAQGEQAKFDALWAG